MHTSMKQRTPVRKTVLFWPSLKLGSITPESQQKRNMISWLELCKRLSVQLYFPSQSWIFLVKTWMWMRFVPIDLIVGSSPDWALLTHKVSALYLMHGPGTDPSAVHFTSRQASLKSPLWKVLLLCIYSILLKPSGGVPHRLIPPFSTRRYELP